MKNVFAKKENGTGCSTGEELVAYLYGELREQEAIAVESHLSACDTCTSEFADLSFARLDVFEWNRDEFAAMETPQIRVPFERLPATQGWLAAVQAFFASPMRWAVPAAGFAVVAIAFSVWLGSTGPVEVAGTGPSVVSRPIPAASPVREDSREEIAETDATEMKPGKKALEPAVSKPRPAKGVPRSVSKPAVAVAAGHRPEVKSVPRTRPALRLNDFEEEDDTTLRLADLLAEIDTRD